MKFQRKGFLSLALAGVLLVSVSAEISVYSIDGCIRWLQSSATSLFASKSFRRFAAPAVVLTGIALGAMWYIRSKRGKKPLNKNKADYFAKQKTDESAEMSESQAVREEQLRLDESLIEKYINDERYLANGIVMVRKSFCKGKELSRQDGLVVKQVKVLHQNRVVPIDKKKVVVGGGLDSCGYQVVKNAFLIVDSIRNNSTDLAERLHSTDFARQWYATLDDHESGIWRGEIIVDRNEEKIVQLIAPKIREMIEDSEAKKANKSRNPHLNYIVDGIVRDYAKTIVSKNDNKPLTITAVGLREEILECIRKQEDNQEANKELFGKIESGQITFIDKSFIIQPNMMVVTDSRKIERGDKPFIEGDQLHLTGEKLNKEEIMRVASRQQWPEGVKCIAIDDISKLDHPEFLLKEDQKDIEELQKRVADEPDNSLYVLFISTSSNYSKNRKARMRERYGHWFTMILNKQGPHREYIIADSKNIVRCDEWVRSVLGTIEGDQVAKAVACSDEECGKIVQGIEYLIKKRDGMVNKPEVTKTNDSILILMDCYKTWGNKEKLHQNFE